MLLTCLFLGTLSSFCGNARRTSQKALLGTFIWFIHHLGSNFSPLTREYACVGRNKNKMADFIEEDKKVQYFPEGSLLNTMIISIIDSEKRFTDILKEPYTVYLIETK